MFADGGNFRVTGGFLNAVNDAAIGGGPADALGQGLAEGQLGVIVGYDRDQISRAYDSSVGTLYGGLYQYVKFKAGTTASNARGQIIFWDDFDDYVVTPDAAATTEAFIAGITLNAVTKGNYGWIQVAGVVGVKFRATVTSNNIGDVVFQLTTTFTADAIADATGTFIGGGAKGLKNLLGVAVEAPADAGIKLVQLRYLGLNL